MHLANQPAASFVLYQGKEVFQTQLPFSTAGCVSNTRGLITQSTLFQFRFLLNLPFLYFCMTCRVHDMFRLHQLLCVHISNLLPTLLAVPRAISILLPSPAREVSNLQL
jgi:hypothetical protein